MLHFCLLCTLFPPPVLGNWRNYRVSSLCSWFLAFCVLLPGTLCVFEVALTVDHEAPQNASWHNDLVKLTSPLRDFHGLLCFQKCKSEQFLSVVFICLGNCSQAFPWCWYSWLQTHTLKALNCWERWWLVLGEMMTGDHDFLSCHNEESL